MDGLELKLRVSSSRLVYGCLFKDGRLHDNLSVGTVGAAPPVVMATAMRAVLVADSLKKQKHTHARPR